MEPEEIFKIEIVKKILLSHGIKMKIEGCGCCGSPGVSFEYNGEKIIDNMDMFED